jgi:hypothetical protein
LQHSYFGEDTVKGALVTLNPPPTNRFLLLLLPVLLAVPKLLRIASSSNKPDLFRSPSLHNVVLLG